MRRRVQHAEIPPEMVGNLEQVVRIRIAKLLGCPVERIVRCELFDPEIEGRSALNVHANPELTDEEMGKVMEFFRKCSTESGARPPIFPGSA